MAKEIYILGIGNNSIVTIDLAEACGYEVVGLYHFEEGRTGEIYYGYQIIGTNDDLFKKDLTGKLFAISVGDNRIRANLYNTILNHNGEVVTLIHPKAFVSKFAKVGKGCCIHAGGVVNPSAVIGNNCVVSFNANVIHGAVMKDHSFIADASLLGANTIFEEYAFLGLNATTISNKVVRIGKFAVIGAGAVVTKSIDDYQVVAGNPAKIIKSLK